VDPEDAAGVSAVGAHFLPEAGGEASVADGQVLGLQPLVPQEGGDGLLRGGDEVLLVHGVVVRLLAALTDDLGGGGSEGTTGEEEEEPRTERFARAFIFIFPRTRKVWEKKCHGTFIFILFII